MNSDSRDGGINDEDHHGTPDERAAAVVRAETAYCDRRSFSDEIQAGINYVSGLCKR